MGREKLENASTSNSKEHLLFFCIYIYIEFNVVFSFYRKWAILLERVSFSSFFA